MVLYVAEGSADGGDLLQCLLQPQASLWALLGRHAPTTGLHLLRHHLTGQTKHTLWCLKHIFVIICLYQNGGKKKSDNEPQLRGRIKWDLNGSLLISALQEVVTMQEKVFFKPAFDWTMTWKPCYNYSSATLMNRNNANGMIELWQKATFSGIMISGFSGGGVAKLCLVSLRKKWVFLLTVWQINTTAIVNNDDKWSECLKQILWVYAVKMWVFNRRDEITRLHQSKRSSASLGECHADKMSHVYEQTLMSGSGRDGGWWWLDGWFFTSTNVSGAQVGQRTRELSKLRPAVTETGSERKQAVLISAFSANWSSRLFRPSSVSGACSTRLQHRKLHSTNLRSPLSREQFSHSN